MEFIASFLPWIQIILSALLVGAVLLQQSGAGVGGALGGSDGGGFYTRRGFEKFLFQGTIVIAILFALSALVTLFL